MTPDTPADGEALAQCCMCGKTGLSTTEDGGPECELHDGRWVCSSACWDIAVSIIDRLIPRPAEPALTAQVNWEARRWEAMLAAFPEAVNDYGEPTMGSSSRQRRNHGNPVLPYSAAAIGSREEIIAGQARRYADALIAAAQESQE